MRGVGLYTTILVGAVLVFFGVIYWPSVQKLTKSEPVPGKQLEMYDLELAENYLKKSKPYDALQVIASHEDSIGDGSEAGQRWLNLLVTASEQTLDVPQLVMIFDTFPNAFEGHEKAALLVAEAFIMSDRDSDYEKLRSDWKGKEVKKNGWLLLDADYLLAQGRHAEAVEFLENNPLTSKEDSGRLARLALLHVAQDPMKSLDYLNLALEKDGANSDLILYKAKLLENLGRDEEAKEAYNFAVGKHPKNALMRDQLADFYLRHKNYVQALNVWKSALNLPASDTLWVKTLFWNKVVTPSKTNWAKIAIPEGKMLPLILYMEELKPGTFWDEKAFGKLPDGERYLQTQQATHWLRLLAALREGDEPQAWRLIQENPFKEQLWDQELEFAIIQTLNYRGTGDFITDPDFMPKGQLRYPLLVEMLSQKHELSDETQALLKSREAYAAIFLSAGWSEAALQLLSTEIIPENYPEWVAFEFTQAMRKNRGDQAALDFAEKQKQTAQLTLLQKEMQARIALNSGNSDLADSLYREIEAQSPEAKSYLARKAFKDKNWYEAKRLTVELIDLYPQNAMLKENLKKIERELG